MKVPTSLLALVAGASAHTLMSEIYIDGKAQGDATCIRTPMDATIAVSPVEDLTSNNMACGIDGTNGVARVCSISGGSTLTFEFREWPDDVSKGPFDIGHYGPCAVYAKKVDDPTTDGAIGDGWFKLWHEGYDESVSKWCTNKVLDNDGHLSINIPDTLQAGYYLIRSELLALHNANLSPADPQFYVGCTQVYLESSGSLVPTNTVSIPGYVSITEESVTYNIYASPLSLPYPNPGPDPIDTTSSGSSSLVSTSSSQTIGLAPSNYIVHNGNWYGVELEQYTTESAGWAQSAICWKQTQACYAAAPPTGATGCKLMEDKCNNVDSLLNGGTFSGPPNYNTVLDAVVSSISLPAAVNAGTVASVVSAVSSVLATSAGASSSAATSAAVSSVVASSYAATSAAVSSVSAQASSAVAEYSDVEEYSEVVATSAVASASSATYAATSTRVRKHRVKASAQPTTFLTSAAEAVETVTTSECDVTTVDVTVYATATAEYEKREAVNANHHHYGHRRVRRAAQPEEGVAMMG